MSVTPRKRQSKAVTLAYASLAGIILLVIAAVALVVVPPSPPSVAEFAPQAQEQILDAPNQQSSQFGAGAGACAVGQVCEEGTAGRPGQGSRKVIEKARVRRCVGDPPRQIEDPQSPPCINYFEGDNGGATWKGVTRDEIRVATMRGMANFDAPFVEFFNRRFEFYGRKIRLVGADSDPDPTLDPSVQRARAVKVAEEFRAFASLSFFTSSAYDMSSYYDELARRGVLSFQSESLYQSEPNDYAKFSPYQWNYRLSLDQIEQNVAEWICAGLAGQKASYGGPDVSDHERVFGLIIVADGADRYPDAKWLQDDLSTCGARPARVAQLKNSASSTQWRSTLSDYKLAGVTSLLCLCHWGSFYGGALGNASDVGYFPEWLVSGLGQQDEDFTVGGSNTRPDENLPVAPSAAPAAQRAHLFGIASRNKVLRPENLPWYWALREVAPNSSAGALFVNPWRYSALLQLASGIQMAGPNLTPQTFQEGLFRTRFPNPGCGGPPYYQACVGFSDRRHTMIDDLGLIWWDEKAENLSQDSGTQKRGAFCYVGAGARYSIGNWSQAPSDEFFDTSRPCR